MVCFAVERPAHEERAQDRHQCHRQEGGSDHGEGFGEGQWVEEFAFLTREREDRHEGQNDDDHGKEDRATYLERRIAGDLQRLRQGESISESCPLLVGLGLLGVSEDILGHHNRGIDQDADGDGDAGQRHDVRGDTELLHEQERRQNRQWQGQGNDDDAPEMPEEQNVGEGYQNHLFPQCVFQGVQGAVNEIAAIVEGAEAHPGRKARLDLGDAFSRFSDDFARILAGPHDDDASDPLLSVDIQRAPPEVAA